MVKNSEVAIVVDNIHKEFTLPQSKNTTFKQTVVNIVKKNNKVTQKVLDGVSFTIDKGDFFGIVGRNGSGKSTLLKLIAGVYYPTSGEITVNGGLTPFIELGVGFNPELSGRDNVFLNGALLGYDRLQMAEMYDSIVEFAELEQFMDQKLKNYSSGMQVRLAFSIAIKAKNDVLIFDEVLAVGDEAFQRKCIDVFEQYKADGQTVILVTHSMDTVKRFCNKALLIHDGVIVENGNPKSVAEKYSGLNQVSTDKDSDRRNNASLISGDFSVKMCDTKGKPANSFVIGESVSLIIGWKKTIIPTDAVWVDLYKKSGEHISNFISCRDSKLLLSDKDKVSLEIGLTLAPGSYYIDIGFWDKDLKKNLFTAYPAYSFSIKSDWSKSSRKFGGLVLLDSEWK